MEEPLWIDRHAPALADLPQADARRLLEGVAEEPMNLVVQGPEGCGKTAAVRALARATHADPDSDYLELNVADFFDRTKTEIRDDPRFTRFLQGQTEFSKQYLSGDKDNQYKRNWSKREMLSHVLAELASYPPADGSFKTILLDNAESIREDFQQALRRIVERHHEATQFVIATRQPSKLIPAIRSRCAPVPMRAPTTAEVRDVLRAVAEAEAVEYDEDGLASLAEYAEGDLRRALLAAQTTHARVGSLTTEAAYEALGDVGVSDRVESMLADAEAGEFTDARSTLDDLLVDEGLDGEAVLAEVLAVGRSRYDGDALARLVRLAGVVDHDLARGTSDRVQVGRLLAELGRDGPVAVGD